MSIHLLLSIPLLNALCAQVPAKVPAPPVVAYLVDNKVYSVGSDGLFLRTDYRLTPGKKPQVEEYGRGGVTGCPSFQFHVAEGAIWWGVDVLGYASRTPIEDLKFDDAKLSFEEWLKTYDKEFVKKYPKAKPWYFMGQDTPHSWKLDLNLDQYAKYGAFRSPDYKSISVLPTSSTSLKAFVLQNDQKVKVWDCKGTWKPDKCLWDVKCQLCEEEDFALPFLEPFHVIGKQRHQGPLGWDYYFLTQCGNLYSAPAPKGDDRRHVQLLWRDKKKPITNLIIDHDHDRSFCFGKSRDGKEEFFFELGPSIKAETVPRNKIQAVPGVKEERLRRVLEYVQVLPEAKKEKAALKPLPEEAGPKVVPEKKKEKPTLVDPAKEKFIPLSLAYIYKNKMYTLPESGGGAGSSLFQIPLQTDKNSSKRVIQYHLYLPSGTPLDPLHFFVAFDAFWWGRHYFIPLKLDSTGLEVPGVLYRVPDDELILHLGAIERDSPEEAEFNRVKEKKYPLLLTTGTGAILQKWNLEMVQRAFPVDKKVESFCDTSSGYAYFPLLINPEKVRTFLLGRDQTMTIWDFKGTWSKEKGKWLVDAGKQGEAPLPSMFLDRFVTLATKDDLCFLTQSGALYLARKPAKGKPRQMEPLWINRKKPITTLIVDVDQGKQYCFGQSKDGKEPFFFEINSEIKAQKTPNVNSRPAQAEQTFQAIQKHLQELEKNPRAGP